MKYEGYEGEMMFTIRDLAKLMGDVSERTVRRHHAKLREEILQGKNRGFITVREFCEYKGVDLNDISSHLKREKFS
ncbi:MAG: hypothetical protein H6581_20570 [Bacteroidia bacterium]|nr:hypothetical protein [Bacteroidia bacterium]